ncbi:MAG: type II toxin-antitoxin system VapC family toxin [Archaeoglobales archaeon]|nr:type II toxin-antitoxin system VapC family toxin [Archaeoglobales archaeon]
MIVLDTSIFVDYLFEKNEKRKEIARKMLGQLEGKEVAVPKVFLIELISIGRRLGFKIKKEDVLEFYSELTFVGEEEIIEILFDVAETVHPRAIDAYFIATAKLTNSILITNDRIMAENAKRYGIEAYYLLEEFDKAIDKISKH